MTKKRRRIPNHAAALERASEEVRLLKARGVDAWVTSDPKGIAVVYPKHGSALRPITIYSSDY